MSNKLIAAAITAGITLIAFSGCHAKPVEETVFLKDGHKMEKNKFLPFHNTWKDPDVNLQDYTKIIVEPVYTSKRLKRSDLEKLNINKLFGTNKKQAFEFIDYTEAAFKKAIDDDRRLQLVTTPGPKTMILQLALVKVVPGKPLIGTARNIPFSKIGLIITPAVKTVAGSTQSPIQASVAIEGRFLDSQTKKVIAKFADNEKDTTALLNVKEMSSYGTPRQIVDQWAKLLVKCLNRKKNEKIERSQRVKIINF